MNSHDGRDSSALPKCERLGGEPDDDEMDELLLTVDDRLSNHGELCGCLPPNESSIFSEIAAKIDDGSVSMVTFHIKQETW